jgi:hypothetical protein
LSGSAWWMTLLNDGGGWVRYQLWMNGSNRQKMDDPGEWLQSCHHDCDGMLGDGWRYYCTLCSLWWLVVTATQKQLTWWMDKSLIRFLAFVLRGVSFRCFCR